MKHFNRILYAVIADIFEKIVQDDPHIPDEEVTQKIYQEFDETLELVFKDINSIAQVTEASAFLIDGDTYSKDEMVDMLVNGIDYISDNAKADVRSLIKYLNKTLDTSFMLYPDMSDGGESIILEKNYHVEAKISFEAGKIFLLQGETDSPDIKLFKLIYPEILKWTKGEDQQTSDDPPTKPEDKSKLNKIKKTDAKEDAIKKAKNYMKNRFDYL